MIQANELRINNWVELNGNNYRVNLVSNNFIEIEVGNRLRGGNPNEHNPISITPSILIKCGFEWEKGLLNHEYIYCNPQNLNDTEFYFYLGEWNRPTESYPIGIIKHLHQLQNLYFALTGEELNVQL